MILGKQVLRTLGLGRQMIHVAYEVSTTLAHKDVAFRLERGTGM